MIYALIGGAVGALAALALIWMATWMLAWSPSRRAERAAVEQAATARHEKALADAAEVVRLLKT